MNENANEKPTELDVLEKIIDNGLKDIEREIARLKERKDAFYSIKTEIESIRYRFSRSAVEPEGATPK